MSVMNKKRMTKGKNGRSSMNGRVSIYDRLFSAPIEDIALGIHLRVVGLV
jgi:hypothetical protein